MKYQKLFTYVIIITLILSCNRQKTANEGVKIDPGFQEYISAFTSGIISSKSNIRIRLTSQYAQTVEAGTFIDDKLFFFEPGIKGKSFWVDNRTIEFRPDEPLNSGQSYQCKFILNKLIEVPSKFKEFPFEIQIINQSFKIQKNNLIPYSGKNLRNYKYEGVLFTADYLENEKIEKIISAIQDGKELPVQWKHDGENKKHSFQIDSIRRKENDDVFMLSWDGSSQGISLKGKEEIEIPGLSNFKVLSIQVFHQPKQYVLISFSDPLDKNQNLQGLISIKKEQNVKFTVEQNQVKLFLRTRISGSRDIVIDKSVRNILGYKLKKGEKKEITFEASKPEIRLLGNGIIIPNSEGIMFPFEAINLNAIDVRIVKIYENNIAQFLQVNHMDGNYQLKRVGRLIKKKKIDLLADNLIDYGSWNAFSIDLSELIESEPGAIYKIELSFKKQYSMYPCEDDFNEEDVVEDDWNESFEVEQSYWDAAENYYYDEGYYYYDWSDRDNPCKKAYYNNKSVSRNVLASNIGLIAKIGKNNELTAIATDLKTTKPLDGIDIDIYNYQQQKVGTSKTNAEGIATIKYDITPFLLVAKSGDQRGYLKLNDGSALSLSKFDVSGAQVQKGLKGFIYGERGVWRPGDSLYLAFILEDKDNMLPEEHPVTFELLNPEGKIMQRMIRASGQNGFYSFATVTDVDAPTGNWMAKVRIGGASFTKAIKIETVKPNRLKINIDFGVERLKVSSGGMKGKMEVKWLHGAIASNLRANIDVTLKSIPTSFSTYADYSFDDPSVEFDPEEKTIFDSRIDENGQATISTDLRVNRRVPGMLQAQFFTKVFEEGGNFSVDQFSIPYAPYNSFVGIKVPKGDKARGMLLTDKKHTVEVVTVDADGNKVSQRNLRAKVYKIEWRWWWESGYDNLASYIGRSHVVPLVSKTLSTTDGFGSFDFEVKYPDWGRYLVQVISPEGHSTGKIIYIDWPGWAGRAQRENPGGASMLTFSADKDSYKVGEEATITFPSSENGRALVSIESGSKVVQMFWVNSEKDQTNFTFTITEAMSPNIYVNITLLQPHAQVKNDLPIRLYGVIPLLVDNPETRIEPVIEMPDELKPEGNVSINVKEKTGKPMTFTLAVVDEGLLDLTRFKTPDPWSSFYAREALGVKTWDIYDMVFGAYGAKIEQVFAIGGDDELGGEKGKKANRFKPVVKYFGPYTLGKNDEKNISFTMPRYVGSVRTMVVAGNTKAYGFAEKATPVKNPLMMIATLPRVLSPGEKVKLPVTIFAMDERIDQVKVDIKTNEFFTISGDSKKSVAFEKPGDTDITFDLIAANKLGVAKVELKAKSGKEEASFEIELDVRAPNPKKTHTYSAVIKPKDTWTQTFEQFGIEGTNEAVIEVSGMPPINLERRLRYLIRYPYGCVEQTTSSVFPQLYIEDVMKLDKDMKNRIKGNIKAGINRLKSFQLSNGGFGYWPGASGVSDWSTNYAGHFIIEAESKGYALPVGMKDQWLDYQQERANQWTGNEDSYYRNDLTQAYRLYTMALANEPDLGAMNRLKEYEKLNITSKYYLALAYSISGNNEAAKDILMNLERDVKDYKELSYTYGSGDRDRSIILESLLQLEMFDEAMVLIELISKHLSDNYWMSTQTTAFCLRAMAKTAEIFEKNLEEFNYSYTLGNNSTLEVMSTTVVNKHELELNQTDSENTIVVKSTSKSPFYVNLSVEGVPIKADEERIEKNLKLNVLYKDLDNNVIPFNNIEQGTDFKVEITVTNPGLMGDYKELALSALFPSGWEIHNTRLYGGGETHLIDKPTYQDIRDDRVYTFFDLRKYEKKTFVILLNASYLGEFTLPAIQCDAMYNNEISARYPGGTVKVVRK